MSIKNTINKTHPDNIFIHPTALIEANVSIGPHSQIWDNVHIRKNATLGHYTSVGEKTYIAYDVNIGSFVKINAMVYICTSVVIEDQCMISAGTVFTNDVFPRSMNKELTGLEVSEPTEETLFTYVRKGTTIGANATIGPGVEIGAYAMIGMGAVVTKDIPAQALAFGNPARVVGYVCICGPKLLDLSKIQTQEAEFRCSRCSRCYRWKNDSLSFMK
jgi:acetyltransferase-like isoleucine patch superfamily enzyme